MQGLEGADQRAELLAFFQVAHGHAKGARSNARHLGGEGGLPCLDRGFQHGHGVIDLTQHIVARRFDVIKIDPRGIACVDHVLRVACDACAVCGNVEQGQPVVGLGQHQQPVRQSTIDDKGLLARQAKTIAFRRGGHCRGIRVELRCFIHRQGIGRVAAGNLGQRGLGARIADVAQGCRRDHCRRQKGADGQRLAHFLRQNTRSGMAHINATGTFRDQHTGPSHRGHLFPHLRVMGLPGIAQVTERFDGSGFIKKTARRVGQHGFVFC